MPKASLADLTLILDRSGSMASLADATVEGIHSFIAEQRKLPGEAFLSIYTFNDQLSTAVEYENIQTVKTPPYEPRGGTALLDAIGLVVNKIGQRLANTPEAQRPEKVIVAIMTDGEENASKTYTKAQVQEMIKHQEEKYAWEFLFLGANIDVVAVSASIGIRKSNAVEYCASVDGVRGAYSGTSKLVGRMRSGSTPKSSP